MMKSIEGWVKLSLLKRGDILKDWIDVGCDDCVCKNCELEGTNDCVEHAYFCIECYGEWGKDRCSKQNMQ